MKFEFEEYSTIEDIFLYLIAVEYTPEVKHLLPVSLYKGICVFHSTIKSIVWRSVDDGLY